MLDVGAFAPLAFDDALAAVQRSGAAVYVVGIGGVAGISLKGERFLRKLAADTGGRAFFPTREIELGPIHSLVANEVTLRYVLTYVPEKAPAEGDAVDPAAAEAGTSGDAGTDEEVAA